MSLGKICHEHPCLKPHHQGPCHQQRPLGVLGSISLCTLESSPCQYFHIYELGRYEFEDSLFPIGWEEYFSPTEK